MSIFLYKDIDKKPNMVSPAPILSLISTANAGQSIIFLFDLILIFEPFLPEVTIRYFDFISGGWIYEST